MCNFVPGQAVAIGPYQSLKNLGDGLPGQLGPVLPLVGELPGPAFPTRLMDLGIVTLRTEPGLELHAVSQLSARLAGAIQSKAAVADVNAILPTAASTPPGNDPLRLSPYAENEADAIRRHLRAALGRIAPPTRIAVLDSGLSENYSAHRDMRYLDYSNGGRLLRDTVPSDPMGHGTRVVSILDRILPVQVGLSVGRLPGTPAGLTALAVCQALGDIVAREHPDVVNLSVAPRSDSFICPHCRQRVPAPTFLSGLLPLVIRLAGESTHGTITVMAAGNSGQPPNSRWLTEDVSTLLFAVAQNRRHERARYSGAPEGPLGDLCTTCAYNSCQSDYCDCFGDLDCRNLALCSYLCVPPSHARKAVHGLGLAGRRQVPVTGRRRTASRPATCS